MSAANRVQVSTIKERCRVCYTCVRECPAKAIRIAERQAEVIQQRCIACGNCMRVCSQDAKVAADDTARVRELIESGRPVAACLAPSFPAEFVDLSHEVVVGMVRALGFERVHEVAVGADLVAAEYARLLARTEGTRYIATSCPAIVGYVQRYHPALVDCLAPIVSPMIATARILRAIYGDDLAVVFIGPCVAKKAEAAEDRVAGEVDAALTFGELRLMLLDEGLNPWNSGPSEFDPPHAGEGALFPITRGMLQAAAIDENLVDADVVTAHGRREFVESIREFGTGDLDVRLLEVLACEGCIMGPGMTVDTPLFRRRSRVSSYVRRRLRTQGATLIGTDSFPELADLDLRRSYDADDQRLRPSEESEIGAILRRIGKFTAKDELNCGACGYATCREHAQAISEGLAESEMCLPYMIEQLSHTCSELTETNERLETTQQALVHAEKLASMGQLAAGIAHEVNNPLSTVLMLSHLLLEESAEGSASREDLAMIAGEADRCKGIVSGLLQFARKNRVDASEADLLELLKRTAGTLRPDASVEVLVECETDERFAEVDRDQVLQVLGNLASNALAAMPGGGTLTLRLAGEGDCARVEVIDTGEGIARENLKRIFDPFFTTKAPGKGTGLGLAVTYGIVKMHHGSIRVESNADSGAGPTGTRFVVELPRRRRAGGEGSNGVGASRGAGSAKGI
jgi:two-component system NtrC family sensor kinase